jgi:hypothetical protein
VAPNNVVCTCPPGYTGNGRVTGTGCANINECDGDPMLCGDYGDCDDTTPGFTCDCDPGFTAVDDQCVCDLSGTFAVRVRTDLSWPAVYASGVATPVISAGTGITYSWALREHTYDENGVLEVTTTPCGGTNPDVCGTNANGAVPAAAYSQYLPNRLWGLSSIPTADEPALSIPNALPNEPFETEMYAATIGIAFPPGQEWDPNDSAGDFGWPNSRADINTNGTGIHWTQPDDDGKFGITSYAVVPPVGGLGLDVSPRAYTQTSPNCPDPADTTPPIAELPYAYWPTPALCFDPGSLVCRVDAFYLASRVISAYKGTVQSCDLITRDIIGPNPDSPMDADTDGEMRTDARIYDCHLTNGTECSSRNSFPGGEPLEDLLDAEPQNQQVNDATFVIKRVPAGLINSDRKVTCDNIRNVMTYP